MSNKVRVKLERHLWKDEIEARKKKKRAIILAIAVSLVILTLGILIGRSIGRNSFAVSNNPILNRVTKIDVVKDIMQNEWYFANEVEDVETDVLDKALYGMTSFEEDIHTSYMSSKEIEAFTTSINMGFVGIGVQYSSISGLNMINRVFRDSPADKAGVLEGDIIYKVDGVDISEMNAEEIASRVKGEKGTYVQIEFLRQGESVVLDIQRDEVNNTAYGYMIDEDTGYLEIYGFGNSTTDECAGYLKDMMDSGMSNLIIDLRDNGGGYLEALVGISSLFLPKDTVCMKQVFPDGQVFESKTAGGNFVDVNDTIILINGNSASASEVLTMALLELYPNTMTLGETSYGKGTVQTTKYFSDGSAIKYTTSKWVSPSDVWINGVGITPDEEVYLHDILYMTYMAMEDEQVFGLDTVSDFNRVCQYALDFLEYEVKRFDGYFDKNTINALNKFKGDLGLSKDGILDAQTFEALVSSVRKEWSYNKDKDLQLQRALEILNSKSY